MQKVAMKSDSDSATIRPHVVHAFHRDVVSNDGYLYTTGNRLSSRLANERLTELTLEAVPMDGGRVLDIGCGDGTYTTDLYDRSGASFVCGIDPVSVAIDVAKTKVGHRDMKFLVGDAGKLEFATGSFDVCCLRGVLHHMAQPERAVAEAVRVARHVVIIEPNGLNPVVKALEKVSQYHRKHHERSFLPRTIDGWVRAAGGEIAFRRFANLVPFFAPDVIARLAKRLEPTVERTPVLRQLFCGVYLVAVTNSNPRA